MEAVPPISPADHQSYCVATSDIVRAASGAEPADLLIINVRIADVFSKRMRSGSVAMTAGYISSVIFDDEKHAAEHLAAIQRSARSVHDGNGAYLIPGLIDAHMHIESSNLTPSRYAELALARGVTTVIADAHEITNVGGLSALKFMMMDAARMPLNIHFNMPSCVPALPQELTGAHVTAEDMHAFSAKHPEVFGLGEMMNFPGVIGADEETLARIAYGHHKTQSQFVDGHAPGVSGAALDAYLAAGIMADHECTSPDELIAKASRGMSVMLREGSCSHDLRNLAPALLERPALLNSCCLCTDDRSPEGILHEGLVNYALYLACDAGLEFMDALSLVTINAARILGFTTRFNLGKRGAIAPSWRADFFLTNSLDMRECPDEVYLGGQLVAAQGKCLVSPAPVSQELSQLQAALSASINLPLIDDQLFEFDASPDDMVIGVCPTNVVTQVRYAKDCDRLNRIVLIERYGAARRIQEEQLSSSAHPSQNSIASSLVGTHIGRAFVDGYHIEHGAVATSIGHDSHNVLVIGDNARDMHAAVKALGQGGLVAVSNGEVIARLELEVGGLMTDGDVHEVVQSHDAFCQAVHRLGLDPQVDPVMSLVFLPLPVIPEVRITPQGIFDVRSLLA